MVKNIFFAGFLGALILGVPALVFGISGRTNFHGPPVWMIGGVYGLLGGGLGFVLGVIGGMVIAVFRGRS